MMIRGRTLSEIAFLILVALLLVVMVPIGIVALLVIWVLSESAEYIRAWRGRRA